MNLLSSAKTLLINFFLKFLNHKDVQQALHDSIYLSKQDLGSIENESSPYNAQEIDGKLSCLREDIVFCTSRFRSGSTALWNVFRNIDSCTSYYEPFNERRWFDPEVRGERIDSTHMEVKDYWHEYNDMDDLKTFYNEDWARIGLFMDAKTWAPAMKAYICELVERATHRPILHFNRIDFRLPWLKHHFPSAKFVHLYRDPRDQWCSFLTDKKSMSKDLVASNYRDAFYLDEWCSDLAKHFPFLDTRNTPHPYQRFYYLWKLSFLYGKRYADQSLSFEHLTQNPVLVAKELFDALDLIDVDLNKALSVLKKPTLEKWKQYADSDWFERYETECERNLTDFLSAQK